MKNILNFSVLILIVALFATYGCKEADNTPEQLKNFKSKMISEPSEQQDSITHLLSKFLTDFIPATSNPQNFKYYSELHGNNFILLVDIPWINTQPKKDQEAIIRVVPMVLDLNEGIKDKNIYVGIYGKKGISIVKTPEGEFYRNNAEQNLLMNYFKE